MEHLREGPLLLIGAIIGYMLADIIYRRRLVQYTQDLHSQTLSAVRSVRESVDSADWWKRSSISSGGDPEEFEDEEDDEDFDDFDFDDEEEDDFDFDDDEEDDFDDDDEEEEEDDDAYNTHKRSRP